MNMSTYSSGGIIYSRHGILGNYGWIYVTSKVERNIKPEIYFRFKLLSITAWKTA